MRSSSVLFNLLVVLAVCVQGQLFDGLRVQGNQLVNGKGQALHLHGASHSGTEFACVQGNGIFDGPHDAASVSVMTGWNINAVRVPLNEDCWLGINGIPPAYSGANYINAIEGYVNTLTSYNMAVILDLHWTAPGTNPAKGQAPMPDMDHSITLWKSVAAKFANRDNVIFDLFNEPYPDNNAWDTEEAWRCWRDGGSCTGVSYQAAGMQDLVNAVRGVGARNLLMLGGIAYSNSLTRWLQYKPNDPLNNLAASWHSYNFNYCNNEGCWNSTVLPVSKSVPVIVGELGENDCQGNYVTPLMNYLDRNGMNYLAWTWNTWDCKSGPALITSYTGTCTNNYGCSVYNHYKKFKTVVEE